MSKSETVEDILREMAHVDDEGRNWCKRIKAAHNRVVEKQRGINKELVDELAKQREYDRKLEADFAALYEENKRLRRAKKEAAK